MKYKKIIELLPAYTLFIFLLSSNSACSNGQANNKQTEDAVTDTITTFVYPEVPTMLNTPELRADYLARHYWEHVNFADTNYIHHPEVTEQAWVNFIDILQLIIRKTKCFDFLKRSVYFPKRNVLFFTSPTLFSTTNYR